MDIQRITHKHGS